jgi:hypothetical protein
MENDLVARFDALQKKVLFFIPNIESGSSKLKRFDEFDQMSEVDADELAKQLGIVLVAFMRSKYGDQFIEDECFNQSIDLRQTNDMSVSFDDARSLIDRLGDYSTIADLDAVTALLEKASLNGDSNSKSYLAERWPNLRAVFERRIARERRLNP